MGWRKRVQSRTSYREAQRGRGPIGQRGIDSRSVQEHRSHDVTFYRGHKCYGAML
jgi:hypothetical protein